MFLIAERRSPLHLKLMNLRNEFHSGRKDRSVSFVIKHALNKNLCQITFYIRKIMLHVKIVQMKIIKMNVDIYSNLST